jgi:hypothetical protein
VPRIRAAFSAAYNYQATIPDPSNPGQTIPNPETAQQHMVRRIREYVKEVVKGYEATTAGNTARQAAATQADTDLGGIT